MYTPINVVPQNLQIPFTALDGGRYSFLPLGIPCAAQADGVVHVGARTGDVPVRAGDIICMKGRGCPGYEGTLVVTGAMVAV